MIEEIGRLGRETFVVLRICRYYDLDRFLAHLLRDLSHAAGQQLRGIRALGLVRRSLTRWSRPAGSAGARPDPLRAGPPSPRPPVPADNGRETSPGSGVAGGAGLLYPVQHRVAVAVQPDLRDALDVTRRLPLLPQACRGIG